MDSFEDFDEIADEGIDMTRTIKCPYRDCNHEGVIELSDFIDEYESDERQMGAEVTSSFNFDKTCDHCGKEYNISGYISEYPMGALNYEEINIIELEELDEDEYEDEDE